MGYKIRTKSKYNHKRHKDKVKESFVYNYGIWTSTASKIFEAAMLGLVKPNDTKKPDNK